mgnify:CR=1 FL=1
MCLYRRYCTIIIGDGVACESLLQVVVAKRLRPLRGVLGSRSLGGRHHRCHSQPLPNSMGNAASAVYHTPTRGPRFEL